MAQIEVYIKGLNEASFIIKSNDGKTPIIDIFSRHFKDNLKYLNLPISTQRCRSETEKKIF